MEQCSSEVDHSFIYPRTEVAPYVHVPSASGSISSAPSVVSLYFNER